MNTSWQTTQLDALFAAWDGPDTPGCAVGVYRAGDILYRRGFGSAHLEHGARNSPSTVFHVASLSKQFTAAALGLLERGGRLSLDEDIRRYVHELPAGPAITFRQIIHHTSGLRDQWDLLRLGGWRDADLKTTSDILRLAARQTGLNFQPGTRFQYINTGYTLAAVAVERLTGMSLREYADQNIFKPLGMADTFFADDHRAIVRNRAQAYSRAADGRLRIDVPAYETVGPTGLFSTVEDFARWESNFHSPVVGDEEFVRQLVTPGSLADGRQTSYGFGLVTGLYRGLEIVEHAGGDAGYRAHFLRFPAERLAVAVFCNFAELKPGRLAREVADVCLAGRFPEGESGDAETTAWAGRAAGFASPSPRELESRCGSYLDALSGTTCRIEERGGRLFLVASAGGEYELAPAGAERFRFQDVDAECLFKPPDGDEPWRMTVFYAGQETAECRRADDDEPDSGWEAAEYAGTFESAELETRYSIEASGDGLTLRRAKFSPCVLARLRADEFSCRGEAIHVRFARDEAGRVSGFTLTAERVWNVAFTRL